MTIPVIAAGGIADGRGMAAAMMLGAEGVQMGTRFVVAKESIVHQNYKERIIKAKDIDSEVTGMSTGHPIRVLRNQMTRDYLKLEKEGASFEELEQLTLGSLRKAVIEGDAVHGSLMARTERRACEKRADMSGDHRGSCHRCQSAACGEENDLTCADLKI